MAQLEALECRRLRAAGDIDPTFGDDGVITYENAGDLMIEDSESLPDGRFIIAGWILGDNDGPDFVLRQFTADGTPDTSFGGGDGIADGRLTAETAVGIRDIVLLPSGEILACVDEWDSPDDDRRFDIARFNADGSLDTTFSGDGFFTVDVGEGFFAFDVQSDGKILFSDTHDLTRFNADGTLDTSFGAGGTVQDPLEFFLAIEPLADGSILLGGSTDQNPLNSDAALLTKLQPNGALDPSFGDDGRVEIDFGSGPNAPGSYFLDIVPLAGGKFLATGHGNNVPVATRYTADGTLDTTFGDAGKTFVPLSANSETRTFVDAQGRIYLTALACIGRLTPDGQLDETFGRVSGAAAASFVDPLLTSDGKLIVSGPRNGPDFTQTDLLLIRRLTDDNAQPSPITLSNRTIVVPGTAGDDFVSGQDTFGIDVQLNDFGRIFAAEDVDVISVTGAGGDDVLRLDDFSLVSAHIKGGDGRDTIRGTDRRDTIEGNAQSDEIHGGVGADLITGNGGNDRIFADGGKDHIYGRAGHDHIRGNGGDDYIDGGEGSDILFGGLGNDRFVSADSIPELVVGGGGNDSADADDDDILEGIETT